MVAVGCGCGGGTERLLEECEPQSFGAANLRQRGGRPGLTLEHVGKQRQADADDLAVLRETFDRTIQERILFAGQLNSTLGQSLVRTTKGRQHFARVCWLEEI